LQITVHGNNHITSGSINASLHGGRLLEVAKQTNESNMRPHIFGGHIQVRPSGITASVIYHNQFPLEGIVDQCGLYGFNKSLASSSSLYIGTTTESR
jgi:hypothetical protein